MRRCRRGPPLSRANTRILINKQTPRIARVSKIQFWAESWSGPPSFGLGWQRTRMGRCSCVCSIRGGQFRFRVNIVNIAKQFKVAPNKPRMLVSIICTQLHLNRTSEMQLGKCCPNRTTFLPKNYPGTSWGRPSRSSWWTHGAVELGRRLCPSDSPPFLLSLNNWRHWDKDIKLWRWWWWWKTKIVKI